MITLEAADLIEGDASAANVVDYTINGVEEASSVVSIKALADGQLPASKGTLYTTPSSTQSIIKSITLVNTDSSARTVNLYVQRDGSNSRRIIPEALSLEANGGCAILADQLYVFKANGAFLASFSYDIVNDTTPQLGGNLDCNTKKIINIVSLGVSGWSNVQISSGVLGATAIYLAVEPETGTSDDLDTLTHLTGVDIVFIRPKDSGDSITVKHGTDNIHLKGGADITLGDEDECLCLIYDNVNSNWLDVGAGIVAHDIGGASHNADTWANLKGKISDITNVTAAELEYVNGVTAAIQGQIDAKLANIVEDTTPQLGGALDGQGNDLNNLGVVFLTEQADAEADVAGKGQLWVNTATPNELYFTTDAGNDIALTTGTAKTAPVAHQASHSPNDGSDALDCAAPGTNITPEQANAEGSADTLARSDHMHYIPSGVPSTVAAANAEGTGAAFARTDHIHQREHAKYTDGEATTQAKAIKRSCAITVEDPSSSEDISIAFTEKAITITEIRAVLIGSATPSVTWTIRHYATDRNNAGNEVVTSGTTTTSTTSGSDVTSFNDATIPLDSFIWLETTAQSGTVTELHITIVYTVD